MLVVPGDPVTYVYDPSRNESRLARLKVDDAIQRAAGRRDPRIVRDHETTKPGSRYIDFLIPGLLGMNLMGSGMWGIGFNIVQTRRRKLLKRYLTASRARTIDGISGIMNVVMMPMWIFSGVFFAYTNFPDAMQPFIQALPLTPLIDALRSIMLEGATLSANLGRLLAIGAWGGASFLAALKLFRWS